MNVLRLIPEQGGEAIAIDQDRVFIGRDPACDIHLRDASVSRHHAEIRKNDDEWVIIDCDSGNGVLIDGARTSHAELLPGQRLQLGNVRFLVQIDRGDDGSTVMLKRSPLLATGDSRMILGAPRGGRSSPALEGPGLLLIVAVLAGGLVVISLGLVAVLYLSGQQTETPPRPPTEASLVTAGATPAPKPIPETPVPEARRQAASLKARPPRGTLLISTDTRAVVFVDGRRNATVRPGGLRRVEVSPGEHIVSFQVSGARHDRTVRTKANGQAVVRFLAQTQAPPPAASPVMAPVSTPPLVVPPTPSSVAGQGAPDAGLLSGTAATARGDFFRALLILKDVAKRLEGDPQAKEELARTEAYLAWTYYGLKRPEQAQAAAERALRADPNVIAQLKNFPAAVTSLLKQAR